jgi:hypothetical protein
MIFQEIKLSQLKGLSTQEHKHSKGVLLPALFDLKYFNLNNPLLVVIIPYF